MYKCKELERLLSNYGRLVASYKKHNIELIESSLTAIRGSEPGFWENVREYLGQAVPELEELKSLYTSNEQYVEKLNNLLNSKDISPVINGNVLMIGPMEITVNIEEYHVLVSIGRKKTRLTDIELSIVSKFIEQTYKKLNSSFNPSRFFKRLLKAYELANINMYLNREVKYGFAVSLKDIFDIFCISPGAVDYKIENFLWDLGRMISREDSLTGYRLELGFSRDVKKMYLIKTEQGESHKASTLTIYQDA